MWLTIRQSCTHLDQTFELGMFDFTPASSQNEICGQTFDNRPDEIHSVACICPGLFPCSQNQVSSSWHEEVWEAAFLLAARWPTEQRQHGTRHIGNRLLYRLCGAEIFPIMIWIGVSNITQLMLVAFLILRHVQNL